MTMTLDQLRAKYTTMVGIAKRERRMREQVFCNDPVALEQKLREIDLLLRLLAEVKDELKARLEVEYEQPVLLDVPKRAEYR